MKTVDEAWEETKHDFPITVGMFSGHKLAFLMFEIAFNAGKRAAFAEVAEDVAAIQETAEKLHDTL